MWTLHITLIIYLSVSYYGLYYHYYFYPYDHILEFIMYNIVIQKTSDKHRKGGPNIWLRISTNYCVDKSRATGINSSCQRTEGSIRIDPGLWEINLDWTAKVMV